MRHTQLQAELFDQCARGAEFGCQSVQRDDRVDGGAGDQRLGGYFADFLSRGGGDSRCVATSHQEDALRTG